MVTRRTTVIALGGLLAGAGAVLGTGAFDSVEAQRSVALETAPDSDALLAFEIIDDDHVSETDGTIDFELVGEATTTYEELVDVRNQGTQTVTSLRFEFEVVGADQPDAVVEDAMKITSGDAAIDAIDESNLLAVSDAGDAGNDELSPGEAVPFGIAVDLTSVGISSIDGDPEITLTIIAETGDQDDGDGGDGPAPNPPDVSLVSDSASIFGSPPRNLEFDVENDGGPVDVSSFTIGMNPPGEGGGDADGAVPEEFGPFEIDFDSGSRTGSEGDSELGEAVDHAPYTLGTDETATYTVEGFDANLNNNELTLTLASDDGTELENATTTLTPPPEN